MALREGFPPYPDPGRAFAIGILLLLIGLLILWSWDRHVTDRSESDARAYTIAMATGTRRLSDAMLA